MVDPGSQKDVDEFCCLKFCDLLTISTLHTLAPSQPGLANWSACSAILEATIPIARGRHPRGTQPGAFLQPVDPLPRGMAQAFPLLGAGLHKQSKK